jgi:protein-tyrosine phosphatase
MVEQEELVDEYILYFYLEPEIENRSYHSQLVYLTKKSLEKKVNKVLKIAVQDKVNDFDLRDFKIWDELMEFLDTLPEYEEDESVLVNPQDFYEKMDQNIDEEFSKAYEKMNEYR